MPINLYAADSLTVQPLDFTTLSEAAAVPVPHRETTETIYKLSQIYLLLFIYLFYLFISRFVHIEYIQVLEQKDIASSTRFNHLPNPINLETV